MAGVLEKIRWPQKKLVVEHSSSAPKLDLRVLELQAAKEILAEIFGVRISDVEEMIQNRYEEAYYRYNSNEKSVVHMAALVLGLQDGDRLVARDPARTCGLMFADKTGERVAYDQTYVHRQAWVLTRGPAGTFQDHNVAGVFHDDRASSLIRYHLFEVVDMDLIMDRNQLFGGIERNDLAMIGVCKPDPGFGRLVFLIIRYEPVETAGKGS